MFGGSQLFDLVLLVDELRDSNLNKDSKTRAEFNDFLRVFGIATYEEARLRIVGAFSKLTAEERASFLRACKPFDLIFVLDNLDAASFRSVTCIIERRINKALLKKSEADDCFIKEMNDALLLIARKCKKIQREICKLKALVSGQLAHH